MDDDIGPCDFTIEDLKLKGMMTSSTTSSVPLELDLGLEELRSTEDFEGIEFESLFGPGLSAYSPGDRSTTSEDSGKFTLFEDYIDVEGALLENRVHQPEVIETTLTPLLTPRHKDHSYRRKETSVIIQPPLQESTLPTTTCHDSTLPPGLFMSKPKRGRPSYRGRDSVKIRRIHNDDENEDYPGKNSKNAIAARENRRKKKIYVETLESHAKELSRENIRFKTENRTLTKKLSDAEEQLEYYKNIIYNQSAIAKIINKFEGGLGNSGELKINPPITQTKGKTSISSHEQENTRLITNNSSAHYEHKRDITTSPSPVRMSGVCIHLDHDYMSLEFCHHCAKNRVLLQSRDK